MDFLKFFKSLHFVQNVFRTQKFKKNEYIRGKKQVLYAQQDLFSKHLSFGNSEQFHLSRQFRKQGLKLICRSHSNELSTTEKTPALLLKFHHGSLLFFCFKPYLCDKTLDGM